MAPTSTRRSRRATRSVLRQLIDSRLAATGQDPLDAIVTGGRKRRTSWYELATQVQQLTGIDISWETLRSWYTPPRAPVA